MDAHDQIDYSRYSILVRIQSRGREFLSLLPPLPPSLVLGVQLILARLVRVNLSRALDITEQNIRDSLAVKEGDVFIDVGASIGGWSTWAAKRVGKTGEVIALEPNELAYEWLRRNVGRETNVITFRVAAHSSSKTIELWTVNNSMSSTTDKDTIEKYGLNLEKAHLVRMNAIRLDSLTQYLKPEQDVIMKIDVEGAEMDTLRGATGILPRTRIAAVEVHNELLRREVESFLSKEGFSTRFISIKGLYPAHVVGLRRSSKSAA